MNRPCVHAGAIKPVPPPRDVCEACVEIGDRWVHLRQCMTCAKTLCCDDSPNKHMSRHGREVGHPIMRSAEPDEDWVFCYRDDANIHETPAGWETYDVNVEVGVWVAGQLVEAGRSLDVEPGYVTEEGFPLGAWLDYVRDQRRRGELDPTDAAAIEALPGWHW